MNKRIIHTVFEQQVEKTATAIAIEEEGRSVTYRELNNRANGLCYNLLERNVRKGSVVAVLLPPGIGLVTALLAVFKSGGLYLPVDIGFSAARLRQLFGQCKPVVLITNATWRSCLPADTDLADTQILLTGEDLRASADKDGCRDLQNPAVDILPSDNNYIFYTSGTTGEGKAILGIHDSLSHFIHWEMGEFSVDSTFRVSALVQHTFDASLRDIFVPLCAGATLCIPPARTKENMGDLTQWLEDSRITLIHCVPSLFRLITRELNERPAIGPVYSEMKHVLIAGEILFAKDIQSWRRTAGEHVELVNLYGPTETTMVKTFHRIREVGGDPSRILHVGKPISNTVVAIINDGVLCSPGEIGDVYIKTPFGTAGYYKNEQLTKSVFVQNPLVDDRVDIVYKTGDRGRYLPDHNIEILSRLDDQVKVNGIRVELSEIHRAVLAMDGVEQAIVLAHRNDELQNELACYYSGKIISTDNMREGLRRVLNGNIIPSYFVYLDVFPVNSNGKIDKTMLPDPRELIQEQSDFEPCGNENEREMEKIWKEVLGGRTGFGRNVSFFQAGGNSLKAILLISRVFKRLNAKISIKDIYEHPTIGGLCGLLFPEKREDRSLILPVSLQESYELSHAQKRLWILESFEETGSLYNISSVWMLEGSLDKSVLQKAYYALVRRHEALRTIFPKIEGIARQVVQDHNNPGFVMGLQDISSCAEQQIRMDELIREAVDNRFDLEKGPLFRMQLIALEPRRHLIILTMHHIISDGWSMQVLFRDIVRLYKHILHGDADSVKPLNIQYKDYSGWLNKQLSGELLGAHRNYWLQQFGGELSVQDLPADHRRPLRKRFHGDSRVITLDLLLTRLIKKRAGEEGVSLFMWLTAIVYVLLYRYTGRKDLIVGTVAAGREHAELEDQVGLYINTLPLRTMVDEDDSFRGLLQKVKKTLLGAFEHQVYPFDLLLEDLDLARDPGRSPLFDVMIVLQNIELTGEKIADIEDLFVNPIPYRSELSKFDLVFNFNEYEEGLVLKLDYNIELFSSSRIQRLTGHLENLARAFADDGSRLLSEVNFLGFAETQKIIYKFNDTAREYPVEKTSIGLFEDQVYKTPGNIAVWYQDNKTTYDELNKTANRLARFLLCKVNLSKGEMVAVMMDRSDSLLITMLGLLKAGGIYLPIDKNYPAERVSRILEDSQATVMITDVPIAGIRFPENIKVVDIHMSREFAGFDVDNLPSQVKSDELAYVIYTSGSSGIPKGVMVEHKSLVNLCYWHIGAFGLNEESRATLFAGIGFDASVWEIWPYLLSGGCLFPVDDATRMDIPRFARFLNDRAITHTFLPTLICEQLQEYSGNHRSAPLKILTGGDALRKFKSTDDQPIFNNYGPTEATVVSTSVLLTGELDNIPIGRPIANTNIVILDEKLNLMPEGLAGEIYIAGDNLARGYLHQPELTAKKFINNPFGGLKGRRLYATGDQGRWMVDGNIEFLGRKDHQVKIRGYRIELQEVENSLLKHPAIDNVVVLLNEADPPYLTAYYTASSVLSPIDLKMFLQELLPLYMLPAFFVKLDMLPLTPNGKIDREELLKSQPVNSAAGPEESDPVEKTLLGIWKEVLHRQDISVVTNFFEAGGHSLKATRILAGIYRHFGVSIDMAAIFVYQTVRDLAGLIRSLPSGSFPEIVPVEEQDYYPLSYSQKRLWLVNGLQESSTAYNICCAYLFQGTFNKSAFIMAFGKLVERHEALRTVFPVIGGQPRQKIYTYREFVEKFKYLEYEGVQKNGEEIRPLIGELLSASFNIEGGPLFKGLLIDKGDGGFLFMLNVHHLIIDGWSLGLLFNEIVALYNAHCHGEICRSLSGCALQYRDYVCWNERHLQNRLDSARHYWVSQFREPVAPLNLGEDFERPEKRKFEGESILFTIDEVDIARIREMLGRNRVTLFMFVLASVKVFLFKMSGQKDIVVGAPSAGRTHKSLEALPGLFVNTLAFRTLIDPQMNFLSLLTSVKDTVLNGFKYEYYPFEMLVNELNEDRDYSRNPLFDVFVTLQNAGSEVIQEMEGVSVDTVQLETSTCQFDISFDLWETGDGVTGKLTYSKDLFLASTAKRMLADFLKLVKKIVDQPEVPVGEISLLDPLTESLTRAWARIKGITVSQVIFDSPFSRDDETKMHVRTLAQQLRDVYGLRVTSGDIYSQKNFSELIDYIRALNGSHREHSRAIEISEHFK